MVMTVSEPMILLDDVRLQLTSAAGEVNILRGLQSIGRSWREGGRCRAVGFRQVDYDDDHRRPGAAEFRACAHQWTGFLLALDEDELALFRRDAVGIVFQAFHLIPTMTALENVAVPLEFAGRRAAFTRAASGLEAVGLSHRLHHYPGQLSGGEQQRVALARAFATDPKLLLADEPTGNLDGETGGKVLDALFELQQRLGTTLILITHDPNLARRCDRLVRLEDGRIADDGRAVAQAVAE